MTVEEVQRRVKKIDRISDDGEAAHGEEDDLHQDVLRAIAGGECADPAALAEAALQTRDISFARWCA